MKIFLLLTLVGLVSCKTTTTVSGNVMDGSGRPDGGAQIYLVNISDTSEVYKSTCDANGNFNIAVKPGKYVLSAISDNQRNQNRHILNALLSSNALRELGITHDSTAVFMNLMDKIPVAISENDYTKVGIMEAEANKIAFPILLDLTLKHKNLLGFTGNNQMRKLEIINVKDEPFDIVIKFAAY